MSLCENAHGPLSRDDEVIIGSYRLRILSDAAPSVSAAKAPQRQEAANSELPVDAAATVGTSLAGPIRRDPDMLEWRVRVHAALVHHMDLRRVDVRGMNDADLREKTAEIIDGIIEREFPTFREPSTSAGLQRKYWTRSIGLGPLEDLLDDDTVTEVMVNRADQIFIERSGQLEESPVVFTTDKAVLAVIERIVAPLGRRIDESSPMVDARLKDGSRVNAVIAPLALKGANITIRKFSKKKLKGEDLLTFGSMTEPMLDFLKIAVREKATSW